MVSCLKALFCPSANLIFHQNFDVSTFRVQNLPNFISFFPMILSPLPSKSSILGGPRPAAQGRLLEQHDTIILQPGALPCPSRMLPRRLSIRPIRGLLCAGLSVHRRAALPPDHRALRRHRTASHHSMAPSNRSYAGAISAIRQRDQYYGHCAYCCIGAREDVIFHLELISQLISTFHMTKVR